VSAAGFIEVGSGVYVLRYPVLDVNVTLVVGDGEALLVDTLSTTAQAAELARAARRVTDSPWFLVNTHHHFDHCFGNATLVDPGGRGVWGHEEAAAALREGGERLRRRWYAEWAPTQPELATGIAQARVLPPDRTVRHATTLEVGGRAVTLAHFGRGHTAGDLTVLVPDAAVVVAGDLVEEGAPPDFADAYPIEWPETLLSLLHAIAPYGRAPRAAVVPGHGAVVDRAFVDHQHGELAALAWLIREGHADGAPAEAVARRSPYPEKTALAAVRRGYAELDGRA
jgi:glyoxylase-like metal-dependent hydrolase (beta-lactamase superfamily II)